MSLFATASFSGGMGELVSNYILEFRGWRWIHWHQLIINSVLMVLIAVFFRESRGPVLLGKRAKTLNAQKARDHGSDIGRDMFVWIVKENEERATLKQMLRVSLTRPFRELLAINSRRPPTYLPNHHVVFL
jgi:MFS family permease